MTTLKSFLTAFSLLVAPMISRADEPAHPLIVAHRGSAGGSVAVNTALGVKAAVLQGARMIEIDVTASRDGEFYCFHDGCEAELLGFESNLQTLPASDIDKASYLWVDRPGRPARVERLLPMLRSFRNSDVLFNVDRSWWRWRSQSLAYRQNSFWSRDFSK